MKKIYVRTLISTGLGAILGIFCILGVRTRIDFIAEPSETIYLLGAWYNRLIMGIVIGLAGQFHFLKEKYYILEAILKGLFIGGIISVSFAFLQQVITLTYFFAGLAYGIIIDVVTTLIIKKLVDKKKIS